MAQTSRSDGRGAAEPVRQPTKDERHNANIEAHSRATDDKLGLTTGALRGVANVLRKGH